MGKRSIALLMTLIIGGCTIGVPTEYGVAEWSIHGEGISAVVESIAENRQDLQPLVDKYVDTMKEAKMAEGEAKVELYMKGIDLFETILEKANEVPEYEYRPSNETRVEE